MDRPGERAQRSKWIGGCGGFATFSSVESVKFDDEPTALMQRERLGHGNKLSNLVHRHTRTVAQVSVVGHGVATARREAQALMLPQARMPCAGPRPGRPTAVVHDEEFRLSDVQSTRDFRFPEWNSPIRAPNPVPSFLIVARRREYLIDASQIVRTRATSEKLLEL